VSVGPQQQVDYNLIEQTRKHINRLVEEIARLSEQEMAPADYYHEFLQRVQQALAATAGAVWAFTPQGHLQLQFQANLRQVGIDQSDITRQTHGELLRHAVTKAQPLRMMPHSGVDGSQTGSGAGNPTDYVVLLAPVLLDKQVNGLIEVFQDANRNPAAHDGYLRFLVVVADLAARFMRNLRMRQMSGQQQVWTQLEAFARQIHGSLNPTETAYYVANEGNRLTGSDRLSVALRHAKKPVVEAISGADVVEKRSNLVQLMRALFDSVLRWDEKLVYSGTRDDSLPPDVLKALDEYLAESNSKFLTVLPLRDEREKDNDKPCRSALMMECFEPNAAADQLVSKLEVVGKHAAPALYNAVEHRRIPLRFIWQPLAKAQEGLGGKTRAIIYAITAAVILLALALVFVPYPLKMDAKGKLLPQSRGFVFSPKEAKVVRFEVGPGDNVVKGQNLALMYDLGLESQLVDWKKRADGILGELGLALAQMREDKTAEEREKLSVDIRTKKEQHNQLMQQIQQWRERVHADDQSAPGHFWLQAPMDGTVLNYNFREEYTDKQVRPSEPVLRVGDKSGVWEIELKVPQKHIGQILHAIKRSPKKELEVDLLLMSEPTKVYKGKLAADQIAGEAKPNQDENNESEPVVLVTVRIDGPGIAPADRLPRDLLLTETEVHAKVRCGNHAMGYSLFYGVWEFLYEKVVFFF
jgi:hypothetical protein